MLAKEDDSQGNVGYWQWTLITLFCYNIQQNNTKAELRYSINKTNIK